MSKLEIDVTASTSSGPERLGFKFSPTDPGSKIARYLDPANGNIDVPMNSGSLLIQFHLKTPEIDLGNGNQKISFHLGATEARHPLKIWKFNAPKTTNDWPGDFRRPSLSNENNTITVLDDNRIPASYRYRLAVGVVSPGQIEVIEVDPIIKNGGHRNTFDWFRSHPVATALLAALAIAGLLALLHWQPWR